MAPLMTTIDTYAALLQDRMRTEFIFLSNDPVRAGQYFPRVAQSLRIKSPMSLSVDGLEGPGNYGLNKECLLTVVIGENGKVTSNFALVQPGIADAPRVIEAMSAVAGDSNTPSAEQLQAMRQPGSGARGSANRRPADNRPASAAPSFDPSQFNLESEAGLREAVSRLLTEVRDLRNELTALRADETSPAADPRGMRGRMKREQAMKGRETAAQPLPGAAPTDAKLVSLLRQFIQKTNSPAEVDAVLAEVDLYIQDQPALRRQAIDGWTRIVHLDYGTEYSVEAGRKKLEDWKGEN